MTGDVSPEAQALLRIAHANSERLVELINNLLDIEKLETQRIAMPTERVDVRTLVTAAVEANQAFATLHHVELQMTGDIEADLSVLGNPGRLQQVLANLISNSIKFTPEGGRVEITAEASGEQVRFVVTDSGPGIPAHLLERVFERFWQVGADDSRGMGLGLYISRCIIVAHGGRIWAESELGKYSAIHFTLPAA